MFKRKIKGRRISKSYKFINTTVTLVLCLFIFLTVHITAADARDRAVGGSELLFDFGYFFFVHRYSSPVQII